MPVKGLYCPCNGRSDNGLDHYKEGMCSDPPAPIGWLIGVVKAETGEPEGVPEVKGGFSVSPSGITGCPRQSVIHKREDHYMDAREKDSTMFGNIAHEFIARNTPKEMGDVEMWFPIKGRPQPTFLGLPMRGKIDFLSKDRKRLADYKFPADWPAKKKLGMVGCELEDEIQLNLYRLAVVQMFGKDPTDMTLWVGWRAPGRALPDRPDVGKAAKQGYKGAWDGVATAFFRRKAKVRTAEWIAAQKPFGGRYTVGEICDMYKWFSGAIREGTKYEDALSRLPMVGETMFGGKKCSIYCNPGVRDLCMRHMGRAGYVDMSVENALLTPTSPKQVEVI